MAGLVALIAALAVATAAGAVLRRREGRFRGGPAPRGERGDGSPRAREVGRAVPPAKMMLTAEDLGVPLGEEATLVQFSTEFCAYCGPAREILGEVAASRDGVALIEIDATERMDLTRRLRVFTTPTVLVLGPDGAIAARSTGAPRKTVVLEALGSVRGSGVVS